MKLELIDKNCRCFCVPGCSLVRLSPPLKQCMLCEVDLHWSSKGFSRIGRSAFRNIISLHFILPLKMQLKKMKKSEKNNKIICQLLTFFVEPERTEILVSAAVHVWRVYVWGNLVNLISWTQCTIFQWRRTRTNETETG